MTDSTVEIGNPNTCVRFNDLQYLQGQVAHLSREVQQLRGALDHERQLRHRINVVLGTIRDAIGARMDE